jgi:hypothetical protein
VSIPAFPSWWAVVPSPLPDEPPIDPALVSPGLLGLAAFVFLVVAVALLYRSMRHQLDKVTPSLPEEPPREPVIPVVDSSTTPPEDPADAPGAPPNDGESPARD